MRSADLSQLWLEQIYDSGDEGVDEVQRRKEPQISRPRLFYFRERYLEGKAQIGLRLRLASMAGDLDYRDLIAVVQKAPLDEPHGGVGAEVLSGVYQRPSADDLGERPEYSMFVRVRESGEQPEWVPGELVRSVVRLLKFDHALVPVRENRYSPWPFVRLVVADTGGVDRPLDLCGDFIDAEPGEPPYKMVERGSVVMDAVTEQGAEGERRLAQNPEGRPVYVLDQMFPGQILIELDEDAGIRLALDELADFRIDGGEVVLRTCDLGTTPG